MFPSAKFQKDPGEIVDMQALHDQNNGASRLTVQAGEQGAFVSIHCIWCVLLRSKRRPAFNGSSMMMRSPPRPVNTPPVEVARRPPPRVVRSSFSVFLRGLTLNCGNIARYQAVSITALKSFACLPASDWAKETPITFFDGLWPSSQAGKATETLNDLSDLGGIVMMRRLH